MQHFPNIGVLTLLTFLPLLGIPVLPLFPENKPERSRYLVIGILLVQCFILFAGILPEYISAET
ncbi:MAG: hypothetical protein NZ108_03655, partial [Bacteroidia bacterium]|nr:hypothetical protein [Bacteroidia bacterium]